MEPPGRKSIEAAVEAVVSIYEIVHTYVICEAQPEQFESGGAEEVAWMHKARDLAADLLEAMWVPDSFHDLGLDIFLLRLIDNGGWKWTDSPESLEQLRTNVDRQRKELGLDLSWD